MNLDQSVIDLAEYLAETYFPQDPIDPIKLADDVNITSSLGSYDDSFDGLLELKGNRFHIFLNQDRLGTLSRPRARFTAAHELGHYYIDSHRRELIRGRAPHPSFTEFQSDYLVERQADEFAANLLMPQTRFVACAKRMPTGLEAILKLSDQFGVSVMSAAIRYALSDSASVAVMLWAETERRWCWSASDVWAITNNKAHKQTRNVPAGSITSELLSDPTASGKDAKGSVFSQWYPFVQPGGPKDQLCTEQAIRLGNFGVLTVLTLER